MAHEIAGVPPDSGAMVIARIEALIVPLVPTGIWGVLIAGNSIAVYFQTSMGSVLYPKQRTLRARWMPNVSLAYQKQAFLGY